MLFPLAKDIKHSLKAINDNVKRKTNRPQIAGQISQFVRFHSKLIQLIYDYTDLLRIIFTIIFTWSIVGICAIMLRLNMMVKCLEKCNQIKCEN